MERFEKPNEAAEREALKHPNGYVYVIDEAFKNKENVPPIAIIGAWKVNAQGIIEGDFIPNSNYQKTF